MDFGLAKDMLTDAIDSEASDEESADYTRYDRRHGALHVAGAGERREARCAHGHLQLWRGALRDAERASAFCEPERGGDHLGHSQSRATDVVTLRAGSAGRGTAHRAQMSAEGSQSPLPANRGSSCIDLQHLGRVSESAPLNISARPEAKAEADAPPAGDKAVYAFLELFALAFTFEGASALIRGESLWRIVGAWLVAIIFFIAGIQWPKIRVWLGQRFGSKRNRYAARHDQGDAIAHRPQVHAPELDCSRGHLSSSPSSQRLTSIFLALNNSTRNQIAGRASPQIARCQ